MGPILCSEITLGWDQLKYKHKYEFRAPNFVQWDGEYARVKEQGLSWLRIGKHGKVGLQLKYKYKYKYKYKLKNKYKYKYKLKYKYKYNWEWAN